MLSCELVVRRGARRRWRPGTGWTGRSSSSRRRASTTSTGTGPARCGWSPAETRAPGRALPGLRQAGHGRRAAPGRGAGRPGRRVRAGRARRGVALPGAAAAGGRRAPRRRRRSRRRSRPRSARLVDRLGPELVDPAGRAAGRGGGGRAARRSTRRCAGCGAGEVVLAGGYDGEYGVVRLFEPKELADLRPGASRPLFDLPAPRAGPRRVPRRPRSRARRAGRRARAVPDRAGPRVGAAERARGRSGEAGTRVVRGAGAACAPVGRPGGAAPGSVLDGLDPEQRAAAAATGPLLVVAGPGTGKTRTLTTRIAYQVGELGVPAAEHLALTFTRRAADELTERLAALLRRPPLVTTFHGLGLRIVREQAARLGLGEDVRVVDEAERLALAREAMGADAPAREVRRLLDHVSALARDPAAARPGAGRPAGPLPGRQARPRPGRPGRPAGPPGRAADRGPGAGRGVPAALAARQRRRVPGRRPGPVRAAAAARARRTATCARSATRTRRSTPSAAPTSASSCASPRTSRPPARCG